MRNLSNCLRWLCALGILCVSFSLPAAETDQELVARIDAAVAKAAKFLAAKQSPEGAWRSDVYAPFKQGDALTPLVMTALLPLPIDGTTEPMCERGMQYLAELSRRTFESPDGLKSLAYPVYTAANVTIALHQQRRAEDEAIRAKWVQALRDLQLSEKTGWKPEDPEYGGWTYGHAAATKPEGGQPLGTLDQPNLSASRFALVALQISGANQQDPTMSRGARFVCGLQNLPGFCAAEERESMDGGFFFIHADTSRNKAGVTVDAAGDATQFNSYGSTTVDGLLALTSFGTVWDANYSVRIMAARNWLEQNFSAIQQPGNFPPDRSAARDGLYYYYCAGLPEALRRASAPRKLSNAPGDADWPQAIVSALLSRQESSGAWRNKVVDQREDDPLVATTLAIQSLTACRAMLVADHRPVVGPGQNGNVICHARDASCHGEKLQYESPPQKHTIGYWVNASDYASWKLRVENPGEYEVVVWQGCGAGQGGSEVAIGVGDEQVAFTVEETGHFQHFRKRSLGRLKLSAGEQELTLKALRKAKAAVADVRQIQLIPVASAE